MQNCHYCALHILYTSKYKNKTNQLNSHEKRGNRRKRVQTLLTRLEKKTNQQSQREKKTETKNKRAKNYEKRKC